MNIRTPHEYGLPEKFDKWRPGQEEALDLLARDTKRHIAICAPTGFGKSGVIVADALDSGEPSCIVTENKGLQDQYMCLALDTPVCTGDLRWVPAVSCKVGTTLLGFDEFRTPNRRNWRRSTVERVALVEKECLTLELIDGRSVTCSTDHKWLVAQNSGSAPVWVSACDLRAGFTRGDSLLDVLDVWDERNGYTAGYLSAAFDCEGHIHQSFTDGNGCDVNVSFAQNAGPVLDSVLEMLKSIGTPYTLGSPGRADQCYRITLSGRRNALRFLGEIRPQRLLNNLNLDLLGMMNPVRPMRIIRVTGCGIQQVVFLQTSTRTLVANGLASHNSDFSCIGMVDLRGRSNYQCQAKPDDPNHTCEQGYASRCQYKGTVACPSSNAEIRASLAPLVVTNYAKWTSSRMYGAGMDHYKRVYFDEGHNTPSAVAQAMQVVLQSREIEDQLGIDFLQGTDAEDMLAWKRWAQIAREQADLAMKLSYARLVGTNDPKPAWVKQYTHLKNLCRRLAVIALSRPGNWVVDEIRGMNGFQFDPIRPGAYAESTLYLRLPRIITVSATLRPKTMYMCGVAKEHFTFREFKSDFNPARSPIHYVPTMRVDRRAEDLGPLWSMLDRVISRRKDRKGIIHTISYARQTEIKERSRYWEKMIINPQGSPATDTVDDFKVAGDGTVLVSPSVGEGYDFPDDECRWQFVCKIPFEPPSKIVKAREAADPEYRAYQALQSLVQAFGRGMRNEKDWCEGFICDSHMDWFWPRFRHLAPQSFHSVLTRSDALPAPLDPSKL